MIPKEIAERLDALTMFTSERDHLEAAIQKALADARDEALNACIKIAQDMVCTHSPIGPLHAAGWTGAANAIEEKIRAYLAAAHPEGKHGT
jgi:hypothetical protein